MRPTVKFRSTQARSSQCLAVLLITAATLGISGCGGGGGSPLTTTTPSPASGNCTDTQFSSFSFANATAQGELSDPLSLQPTITISSGCTTPVYSAVGNLAPGLTLNANTGAISGTPTAGGNYSITIKANTSTPREASIQLQVLPLQGAQTENLSASLVTSTLPTILGPQLASVGNDADEQLVLMGKSPSANTMLFYKSADRGKTWTALPTAGQPTITAPVLAANQFRITKAGNDLFLLANAGSNQANYLSTTGALLNDIYTAPSAIYKFDGNAWNVVEPNLFSAWTGAAFFYDGYVLNTLFTRPQQLAFEQASLDGSLRVTYSSLDGDFREFQQADANNCGGYAQGMYFFLPAGNPSVNSDPLWTRSPVGDAQITAWVPATPSFSLINYTSRSRACTVFRNKFWVAGSPSGADYLTLVSAESGTSVNFPRRYRAAPRFVNIAAVGNAMYGVSVNASGVAAQLWKME